MQLWWSEKRDYSMKCTQYLQQGLATPGTWRMPGTPTSHASLNPAGYRREHGWNQLVSHLPQFPPTSLSLPIADIEALNRGCCATHSTSIGTACSCRFQFWPVKSSNQKVITVATASYTLCRSSLGMEKNQILSVGRSSSAKSVSKGLDWRQWYRGWDHCWHQSSALLTSHPVLPLTYFFFFLLHPHIRQARFGPGVELPALILDW